MSYEDFCTDSIEKMLERSQTKIIFPLITLGLVKEYHDKGKCLFSDTEIRKCYEETVKYMVDYLNHDLHIGGRYYDAYPSRNLPKYGVLKVTGNKQYELLSPYKTSAEILISWIPERIKQHINERLGLIPNLGDQSYRAKLSTNKPQFISAIKEYANKNPTNFEIFSFAVMKVHLEKFACKIYRDTRTSAHDKGVDLSTNFGVVYQIKKLKIYNKKLADSIYADLRVNFDSERLNDGNVILVIDDISKAIKNYLINMKVQSISNNDILRLAEQFEDIEDREKVLRIVYEEFRREYKSEIK
jgi:hypothetical protein